MYFSYRGYFFPKAFFSLYTPQFPYTKNTFAPRLFPKISPENFFLKSFFTIKFDIYN
jgi:hypothetical protein